MRKILVVVVVGGPRGHQHVDIGINNLLTEQDVARLIACRSSLKRSMMSLRATLVCVFCSIV